MNNEVLLSLHFSIERPMVVRCFHTSQRWIDEIDFRHHIIVRSPYPCSWTAHGVAESVAREIKMRHLLSGPLDVVFRWFAMWWIPKEWIHHDRGGVIVLQRCGILRMTLTLTTLVVTGTNIMCWETPCNFLQYDVPYRFCVLRGIV